MTSFYFHLHEGGVVTLDDEGYEVSSVAAAQDRAKPAARSIMCSDITDGHLCLDCYIEIENGDTGERFRVAFQDAIKITGWKSDKD